jgi:DNA-binding response OmpR family regulator
MDVGMVGYIVKPYKPEELLERLEKFFETTTYVAPENGNGGGEEQDE